VLGSVLFAGTLLGAYLAGWMADRYGRRSGVFFSLLFCLVFGLTSAFATSYEMLLWARLLVGVGVGANAAALSLYAEFLPKKRRGWQLLMFLTFFSLGSLLVVLFSWMVMPRFGWRGLLVACAAPSLLVGIACWLWLPESPRFLVMKGRLRQAYTILLQAAAANCTYLPDHLLPLDTQKSRHAAGDASSGGDSAAAANRTVRAGRGDNPSDIVFLAEFQPLFWKSLRSSTVLLACIFFLIALLYNCLVLLTVALVQTAEPTLATGSDGGATAGHPAGHTGLTTAPKTPVSDADGGAGAGCFLSNGQLIQIFLGNLAEFPGLILAGLLVDRMGRKRTIAFLFLTAGIFVTLLALPLTRMGAFGAFAQSAVIFVARACGLGVIASLWVYTAELYPTAVRTSGLGVTTSCARIGGMVSPFVAEYLFVQWSELALLLCFLLCVVGAGLVLLLPRETHNSALMDQVPLQPLTPGFKSIESADHVPHQQPPVLDIADHAVAAPVGSAARPPVKSTAPVNAKAAAAAASEAGRRALKSALKAASAPPTAASLAAAAPGSAVAAAAALAASSSASSATGTRGSSLGAQPPQQLAEVGSPPSMGSDMQLSLHLDDYSEDDLTKLEREQGADHASLPLVIDRMRGALSGTPATSSLNTRAGTAVKSGQTAASPVKVTAPVTNASRSTAAIVQTGGASSDNGLPLSHDSRALSTGSGVSSVSRNWVAVTGGAQPHSDASAPASTSASAAVVPVSDTSVVEPSSTAAPAAIHSSAVVPSSSVQSPVQHKGSALLAGVDAAPDASFVLVAPPSDQGLASPVAASVPNADAASITAASATPPGAAVVQSAHDTAAALSPVMALTAVPRATSDGWVISSDTSQDPSAASTVLVTQVGADAGHVSCDHVPALAPANDTVDAASAAVTSTDQHQPASMDEVPVVPLTSSADDDDAAGDQEAASAAAAPSTSGQQSGSAGGASASKGSKKKKSGRSKGR